MIKKGSIFLWIFCFFCHILHAQALVESDEVIDGKRCVKTNNYVCFHGTDGAWYKDVEFQLSAIVNEGNHFYALYMQFMTGNPFKTISVPKGGKLLIRLSNNDIIELSNLNSRGDVGCFIIKEEQIRAISNGVKKMRIETNKKFIDYKFKKNSKFPDRLVSALETLQEYLTYGRKQLVTKGIKEKEDIRKGF